MKKTYHTPALLSVAFDTEEILEISYNGGNSILEDKNSADKKPADGFGNAVDIF